MSERDPFWDSRAEVQKTEAAQPWTWPRAFAAVGSRIVFWSAVVAIVYVAMRYG